MSVCLSELNDSAPTGKIFMKSDIWLFFSNIVKCQVSLKLDNNNVHLAWRRVYIYDKVLPNSTQNNKYFRQICRHNQKTRFIFSKPLPRKQCRLWDNVELFCRAWKATDDGVCPLYPGNEAADTNSEHVNVMFIAFPLRHSLHERSSVLRYTYIDWLVYLNKGRRAANSKVKCQYDEDARLLQNECCIRI